jgi:cell division protein FtsW (lipid II flippase)
MKLIERVSRWLVINMGEFMKLAVSMMSALMGYAEEEEEKEKKPAVPAELRAKMLEAFMPLMQNLITMLVSTMTRAFAPQLSQHVQMATAPAPPVSKPVKVMSSKKREPSAESA